MISFLLLLVTLVASEQAQQIDSRAVLQQTQASLEARQNIRYEFKSTTLEYPESPKSLRSFSRSVSGGTVLSKGRLLRTEHRVNGGADPPNQEQNIVDAYNGRTQKLLRSNSSSSVGYIDPDQQSSPMYSGEFLFNGQLDGLFDLQPDLKRMSFSAYLLQNGSKLEAVEDTGPDGNPAVRISGDLPWGSCTLWIDPQRGYNLTGIKAEIRPSLAYNASKLQYDIGPIQLAKLGDLWVPTGAKVVMMGFFGPDSPKYAVPSFETQSVEIISLSNMSLLAGDESDDLFDIKWPVGTEVTDRILGVSYVEGGVKGSSLDRMVSEVAAARGIKLDTQPTGPGAATAHNQTQPAGQRERPPIAPAVSWVKDSRTLLYVAAPILILLAGLILWRKRKAPKNT